MVYLIKFSYLIFFNEIWFVGKMQQSIFCCFSICRFSLLMYRNSSSFNTRKHLIKKTVNAKINFELRIILKILLLKSTSVFEWIFFASVSYFKYLSKMLLRRYQLLRSTRTVSWQHAQPVVTLCSKVTAYDLKQTGCIYFVVWFVFLPSLIFQNCVQPCRYMLWVSCAKVWHISA